MANFNKVILLGNLTRDPALKFLPSQMAVVDFGLAVNEKWKDKDGNQMESVCFIDCTAFGKTAEVINQYCQKGKQLLVEGKLKFEQWEDKQGGGKRSKHKVVVESFQFVGPRMDGGGGDEPTERKQQPSRQHQTAVAAADTGVFQEDDIPFDFAR